MCRSRCANWLRAIMIVQINDRRMYEKVRDECGEQLAGCYRLVGLSPSGNPIPIRRMLGDDEDGVLYIGASVRLPGRLASLKKALLASYGEGGYLNKYVHNAAAKLTPGSMKLFPDTNCFHVEVRKGDLTWSPKDKAHFVEEARLLRRYHDRWGEYPPLNG